MGKRPILFSGPMVRAILAGKKTQTRRVVKLSGTDVVEERDDGVWWPWTPQHDGWIACPYGVPSDTLWVRETWTSAEGAGRASVDALQSGGWPIWYQADGASFFPFAKSGGPLFTTRADFWRPSIFMPRWASRITLEIETVRVERLHDITEEDARAEGMECESDRAWFGAVGTDDPFATAVSRGHRAAFEHGWDLINGKRAPWKSNPWVWVVEFSRMEASDG